MYKNKIALTPKLRNQLTELTLKKQLRLDQICKALGWGRMRTISSIQSLGITRNSSYTYGKVEKWIRL